MFLTKVHYANEPSRMSVRVLSICLLIGGTMAPAFAFAQGQPSPQQVTPAASAAAEDLFQRATALMKAEDYALACPLLAESHRLDPSGGTLLNLATCHERVGQWASAYARFQELRALSAKASPPRNDRVALADERLAVLRDKLARVYLDTQPGVDAAALDVRIDGVSYTRAAWQAGILLDPGEHTLRVSAAGKREHSSVVEVPTGGGQVRFRVPELVDAPAEVSPTVQPGEPESGSAGLRTAGWVAGGVGVAAVAVGSVFGVLAMSKNDSASGRCDGPASVDVDGSGNCYLGTAALDRANQEKSSARTFATLSTVLIPVGVLGLGAGAFLLWRGSARSATQTGITVHVAPTLGGALVKGSF